MFGESALMKSTKLSLFCLGILASINVVALESDLLQPVEGFSGNNIQATVMEIKSVASENLDAGIAESEKSIITDQKIVVYIDTPEGDITSVQVLDKNDAVVPQKKRFEVLENVEKDRTGIVIYFGKKRNKAFKLNLHVETDE